VLAVDARDMPEPDEEEQSIGLKAGHKTPARCPSTCRMTNASENVAGVMSTSMKIRLSPASLPERVAQDTASSSRARANNDISLMCKTDKKLHRLQVFELRVHCLVEYWMRVGVEVTATVTVSNCGGRPECLPSTGGEQAGCDEVTHLRSLP
jgi:hypothetical protein